LITVKSIEGGIVCLLGMGIAAGGRKIVSFIYASELVPLNYINHLVVFILCIESLMILLQVLLYKIIANWFPIHIIGFLFFCFIVVFLPFIPESPKFFY